MTTPHASWAGIYDFAYEESFGSAYGELTALTLSAVESCVRPPARIVDFGAGTGRLSLPLSRMGYDVVAVEPCQEMADQLQAKPCSEKVRVVIKNMESFSTDEPFDLALCVFTVLLYLTSAEALERSIRAAADVLRPGGLFLIDVPSRAVFRSFQSNTPTLDRAVTITCHDDDLYTYQETTTAISIEGNCTYSDSFAIRYWEPEYVAELLARCGFVLERDLTDVFHGSGSRYFLMRKTGPV